MNRDVDMFCSNLQVQKFVKLVFIVEGGPLVKLDDNAFMVKCSDAVQEGCQLFIILKVASPSSAALCDCCSRRRMMMEITTVSFGERRKNTSQLSMCRKWPMKPW